MFSSAIQAIKITKYDYCGVYIFFSFSGICTDAANIIILRALIYGSIRYVAASFVLQRIRYDILIYTLTYVHMLVYIMLYKCGV